MIYLKKLKGPFGIPVFHQRMPSTVNKVSMGWLMFTGAGDDTLVGSPGLHHWFEHVPFRGTKKYPKGVAAIEGQFTPHNGYINAWTNHEATHYHATVHKKQWREALSVITDMVANPLLTTKGVEAERRVIHQEIAGSLASAGGRAAYELSGILYPGHAFGNPILGSEDTLAEMDAKTLRRAHKLGYDRSRTAFVCFGDISESDLMKALEVSAAELPDQGLSPRYKPAYFGPLPSWKPITTVRETEFATSVIYMLFPTIVNKGNAAVMSEVSHTCELLDMVFGHEGLASPLMGTVREQRQLVYGCGTRWNTYAGGGYFGFKATAKKENIGRIIEAYHDVLKDPVLRCPKRLASMKSCLKAEMEMTPLDPEDYLERSVLKLINTGGVMVNDERAIEQLERVTTDDIDYRLSFLNPENARLVIFKGMGK